jgi:rod shape determining protein RodA
MNQRLPRPSLDAPLLGLLGLLAGLGLAVLWSAGGQDPVLLRSQGVRLGLALVLLVAVAAMPPHWMVRLTPAAYAGTLGLLAVVDLIGVVGHGAQRWLDLGPVRFQPSELAKLAVPMMVAWVARAPVLPLADRSALLCLVVIAVPVGLIALQPDLGTALLVASGGVAVLFLAGLSWRFLAILGSTLLAAGPALWYFMHDYQRARVLTLFNPQLDPLGAGYHTIQAQIAIGSGGIWGKGWLQGTQAQLDFIPERATDFVFAVYAEEFGLVGAVALVVLYALVIARGFALSAASGDPFGRLVGGGLTAVFFTYAFVNLGMVCGILPVVGVPLPLLSYGGTALVTLGASFGVLMALAAQRKLVPG